MTDTRAWARTAVAVVALLAAACTSTPGGTPTASAGGSSARPASSGSSGPAATTSPSSADPSSAPPASATSTATTAPRSGTWSQPQPVGDVSCWDFSAALDAGTGYHVVAQCDDGLQHLSSRTGDEWAAEPVPAPEEGRAGGPHIALDNGWLYVAYSRIDATEAETCGSGGHSVYLGVEVRARQLPDGDWAEPARIGAAGDGLQSLRVVDTLIYATVAPDDGSDAALVTNGEGPAPRVAIPGARGTSLRIGDDGRPRIAYSTGHAIGLGTVDGGAVTTSVVAEAHGTEIGAPALVLAPGDVSSVVWTQTPTEGEGCGEETTEEGTWFATDATGEWEVTQISEMTGQTSLTLDVARDEAHVLLANGEELHHFVRDGDGSWSSSLLPGRGMYPFIRVDPATDALVAFALVDGQIRMLRQQ